MMEVKRKGWGVQKFGNLEALKIWMWKVDYSVWSPDAFKQKQDTPLSEIL